MQIAETLPYLKKGKYIVWVSDDETVESAPDYLQRHIVCIVETAEYGLNLCRQLQRKEREKMA